MQEKLYIYILKDPGEVSQTIYVGFTNNPEGRLARHLQPNELAKNRYKDCWIKSLLNRDIFPEMIILEEVQESNWQEAEQFYIAYFQSLGIKLCNSTVGGDGTLGHKHTEYTKELMRQKKIGIAKTEEWKQSISNQDVLNDISYIIELYAAGYSLREIGELYDTHHSVITYHIEKAGIQLREEKFTARSIEKLQQANMGKTQSDETKQKRSNSLKGRKRPPEVCAKISASHKGKTLTEEHRAKLSIAKQGAGSPTFKANIDNDVIVSLFNKGMSFRSIGKEVGLEHHAVKARLKKIGAIV